MTLNVPDQDLVFCVCHRGHTQARTAKARPPRFIARFAYDVEFAFGGCLLCRNTAMMPRALLVDLTLRASEPAAKSGAGGWPALSLESAELIEILDAHGCGPDRIECFSNPVFTLYPYRHGWLRRDPRVRGGPA